MEAIAVVVIRAAWVLSDELAVQVISLSRPCFRFLGAVRFEDVSDLATEIMADNRDI